MELECNAVEQDNALKSLKMEKDVLAKETEDLRQELARHVDGTDVQTEVAKVEAKFLKMKEVYNKLREQHIELLRGVSSFIDLSGVLSFLVIRLRVTSQMADSI